MKQLVQLQEDEGTLSKARVKVVAISYDAQKDLASFAKDREIGFPLLSDPESKAIEAFGIRNEEVAKGSRKDGIPHPATFLITRDGQIRGKLAGSVFVRHSTKQLLEAAGRARAAATKGAETPGDAGTSGDTAEPKSSAGE